MLPSMPVLFTRDSQDAFGNKIQPSTSFFGQNPFKKSINPVIETAPAPPQPPPPQPKPVPKEPKAKANGKKKDLADEEPPKIDRNAKESALVSSFYTKVQSRFASNPRVPSDKFLKFQEILKTFNIHNESPVLLYNKIEELFGEEHKDLADEFVMFLSPGQAAECGRLMDNLMTSQMHSFLELLQTTFARKPTMLRKVLRAIANSANCGSVEEIRSKVLPHLRSSPRLTQMFKCFLPDERPPDSLYESNVDTVSEAFVTSTDIGHDVWELPDSTDRRQTSTNENLDSVYLHGRVFLQHGRFIRPARVSFPYSKEPYRVHVRRLAPSHLHASPPQEANKKATPRKPRTTKPPKINKDVNDNTKHKERKTPNKKCKKRVEKKEPPKAKLDVSIEAKKKGSWTRDEDKTMLEIMKGEAVSDQVFVRIKDLLPHRSVSEIKERFFHVMNLLQQMAVGEVT